VGTPAKGYASRSLWQRFIPVRVRQNILVLLGAVVLVALAIASFGSLQIRPTVFSEETAAGGVPVTFDISGKVDLFDKRSRTALRCKSAKSDSRR
jgi:hypothetical protein